MKKLKCQGLDYKFDQIQKAIQNPKRIFFIAVSINIAFRTFYYINIHIKKTDL